MIGSMKRGLDESATSHGREEQRHVECVVQAKGEIEAM